MIETVVRAPIKILLGVLFYVIVSPIAVVLRILGHDPMRLRFDEQAKTYRIENRRQAPQKH